MHQATELDLFYLEHWSVGLDLRILARTLSIVLDGVGAF
jgi:lipopolysaccharide/colanic/teichoic acid biosynthesis glycosyltransferase